MKNINNNDIITKDIRTKTNYNFTLIEPTIHVELHAAFSDPPTRISLFSLICVLHLRECACQPLDQSTGIRVLISQQLHK